MERLSQQSHAAQAGVSLVSIIFGIAIGGVAIVVAMEQFKSTQQLSDDFARQDVLGYLEEKVRSAVRFSMPLNITADVTLRR